LYYEFDDGECSKESASETVRRIAEQEAEANAKLEDQKKTLCHQNMVYLRTTFSKPANYETPPSCKLKQRKYDML